MEQYRQLLNYVTRLKGKLDYSGTNSFWQVTAQDGKYIELKECERFPNDIKIYTKKELQEKFIKLSDFLDKAFFVGKEFQRTKPILTRTGKLDRSFMKFINDIEDDKYIVLYATQDLFLIKKISKKHGNKYKLINSRYTLDGNYKLFGPIHKEYQDKNKVYTEIINQINEKYRGIKQK